MKKPTRRSKLALSAMLTASLFSTGCDPVDWVGPNLTVYLSVPFGLAGNPGLLNPFGIVQALVNNALGLSTNGTTDNAAANAAPQATPNIGAITPTLGGSITAPQAPTSL
ncbi:MAG: hypothetical protein KDA33_09480 [Phycisphaerales bacterium]|nr:hypothetical protein [Phycisphaerales bacterium]